MNSSDEAGAEFRQLSQAEVLQMVEDGLFSPSDAERWAKNHNYPPFAPGPVDAPAGSEPDHQWWTLPMAASWFTWRSRRAVHHQSKSARIGWKRWVVESPPRLRSCLRNVAWLISASRRLGMSSARQFRIREPPSCSA